MTSRNFEPKVNWWLMGVEMQSDHLFKTLCFLPDFCTSRTKLMSSVHTRIFKALFYIRFYLFSKKKSRRNYFRKRRLIFWDQILFWSNFFLEIWGLLKWRTKISHLGHWGKQGCMAKLRKNSNISQRSSTYFSVKVRNKSKKNKVKTV